MSDTYQPSDVHCLARVVERYCAWQGVSCDSDRQAVATEVMAIYRHGIHEEEEILAALLHKGDRAKAHMPSA
ncbi:hypothetical protein ABMA32_13960 [Mesorhizobium sp. VNQ89]|uniref:hypothetical protein n=1 Tax=Mesorhizobium quangtriensis TaxID=3157709 RepID=UPI0032B73D9D